MTQSRQFSGRIDPAEIVGMCVRAASPAAAAAKVEVTVDYNRDAAFTLRADPRRLRQAIASLLSNALKFTHAGGAVRVEVAHRASPRAGEPPFVSIAITDTGKGMSIEEMEIAFQSFRQVDGTLTRRRDGIGIGLPLAKRLCEAMNGRLTLDSAPARGTTARVEFPAVPAFAPA